MKTIKFLALHHAMPHANSHTVLFFKNLLPELKKTTNVHLTWLIYTPNKIDTYTEEPDVDILDIHDFKNALEIIQKVKPDVIHIDPAPNFIFYAFYLVSKSLNIPIIGFFDHYVGGKIERTKLYKSFLHEFFQNSIPSDNETNKKQFMRRGRFFIYKYLFLLKSQITIPLSLWKIIKDFFMFVKIFLNYTKYPLYPVFSCDLHFLDNENLIQPLINAGFKQSTLLVTGNPMYDPACNLSMTPNKCNKIRVLLLTASLYEHGLWTKTQRDKLFENIVREITKSFDMLLTVKIHPSSENLNDYKLLIKKLGIDIQLYQSGDILDFIKNADVVLGYFYESAISYALIARRPTIICNFYNMDDMFIKKGFVTECKDPSLLADLIKKVYHSNPIPSHKIDEYIKEFHYRSDGLSAKRVCNGLLKLIQ